MSFTDLIPWRRPARLSTTEWPPVFSLQREMNRMLDDFWGNDGRLAGSPQPGGLGSFYPELDLAESDKHIDVTAELAGMIEKDIKLSLTDDGQTLTIEGEKKSEEETESEGVYCSERRYGRFRRAIALPSRVDSDGVEATSKDGVLKVHMKKLPEKDQHIKQIPITAV